MLTEILTIDKKPSEKLIDLAIDTPVVGYQDSHFIEIKGWVLGHQPITTILLTNANGSHQYGKISVNLPRPDVAQQYADIPHAHHCGFYLRFSLLGRPSIFELHLRALQGDLSLGVIQLRRHRYLRGTYPVQLQPLMVTSLERSGSTWLMHVLAQHTRIVAYRQYPYEAYAAKYWLYQLFKTLTEPGTFLNEATSPKVLWVASQWFRGHLSQDARLAHWFNYDHLDQLATFCQQSIETFYQQVAVNQGQVGKRAFFDRLVGKFRKQSPGYFAEKFGPGPAFLTGLLYELYPQAREIILVRDFRDMLCSLLDFSDQRKAADFGYPDDKNKILEEVKTRARRLADYWQLRVQQAHLVRYEDLILHPQATLSSLLGYLGLAADAAVVDRLFALATTREAGVLQAHRTSVDPQASIERWRRDLDAVWRVRSGELLREELGLFGYVVS